MCFESQIVQNETRNLKRTLSARFNEKRFWNSTRIFYKVWHANLHRPLKRTHTLSTFLDCTRKFSHLVKTSVRPKQNNSANYTARTRLNIDILSKFVKALNIGRAHWKNHIRTRRLILWSLKSPRPWLLGPCNGSQTLISFRCQSSPNIRPCLP